MNATLNFESYKKLRDYFDQSDTIPFPIPGIGDQEMKFWYGYKEKGNAVFVVQKTAKKMKHSYSLFTDYESFKSYLSAHFCPVMENIEDYWLQNDPKYKLYKKYGNEYKSLHFYVKQYLAELEKMLGFSIHIEDEIDIKAINKKVNEIIEFRLYPIDKIFMSLLIFIGELLKKENPDLKWDLYNDPYLRAPGIYYFDPILKSTVKEFHLFYGLYKYLFAASDLPGDDIGFSIEGVILYSAT